MGATAERSASAERRRTLWIRAVLAGLVLLVAGTTAALFASAVPPCVPEAVGMPAPPLMECVPSVGPWIALALLGLVLAVVAYRRVP